MDDLDHRLIELLRTNARLPLARLAKALGVARSTIQLRLKALEDQGIISGYTISVTRPNNSPGIDAMVLISVDSGQEASVIRALSKRFEINRLYTVSGRYDICAMLRTETTQELDQMIDRIRATPGVTETFSNILLSKKLQRPD
jgi:DNA-binding Lrp family transcriptional regulator